MKQLAYDDRRKSERQTTWQQVVLRTGLSTTYCELLDVSGKGAKVLVKNGIVPHAGVDTILEFIDGQVIEGRVAWVDASTLGLTFSQHLDVTADVLHHDHMGVNYFLSVIRHQKSRHGG